MPTTTAQKQITGEPKVLARYDCDEGARQLVAQRVRGVVALSDVPAGEEGRVRLVERRLESLAELDALVADYLEKAAALGRCPMASADWWNN